MCADPENTNSCFELTVVFALLGPAQVKAARKMLMKLTRDVITIIDVSDQAND